MKPALAGYAPAPLFDFTGGGSFIGNLLDGLLGGNDGPGGATWQGRSGGTSDAPSAEGAEGR